MTLVPRTGTTRHGLPVSLTRTPPPDLARHVARFFITRFDQPEEAVLEDFLLHEWAYLRMPIGSGWSMRTEAGWSAHEGPMLFGAQRKPFWVRCRGPVLAAGFAIRPGAWFTFSDRRAKLLADRLETINGDMAARMRWACADVTDHEQTFTRLEAMVRAAVAASKIAVDPIAERFEVIARTNPSRGVAGIARALDVPGHQLERRVHNHFGHMPKTVLRRSRFLDMAAVMRGLAIPDADGAVETRFYDQSHLNREFRLFADMTPARFRAAPTPLLTAGLEVRQQFKLADRAVRADGAAPPWLAPAPGP